MGAIIYYYENMPLTLYCKQHPEIKYGNIKQSIKKSIKKLKAKNGSVTA